MLIMTLGSMTSCGGCKGSSDFPAWLLLLGQKKSITPVEGIELAGTIGQIDKITLYWTVPDVSLPITGYKIIRSETSGTSADFEAHGTSSSSPYADSGSLTNGTTYYYRVAAMNKRTVLSYSNEVAASSVASTDTVDTDFIFVDVNYTGGGSNGSSAKPFTAIADGVTALEGDGDGGTVLVRDGTYSMSAAVTLSYADELRSETGRYEYSSVILDGGKATVSAIVIAATGDSSIVRGLTLTNYGLEASSNGLINFKGGANDVQILYNYLHDNLGRSICKVGSVATSGTVIKGNTIYSQGTTDTTAIWLVTIDNCTITGNTIDTIPYAGMIFTSVTNTTVSYNTVRNTQNHGLNIGPLCGNITVAHNTFENCVLTGRTDHGGVRFYGEELNGSITIEHNTITNCVNGLYLRAGDSGHTVSLGTITAHDNIITDNVNRSICNMTDDSVIIDATNNWFGTDTGPYNAASNPTGTGDTIDDNVTFSPWLTEEPDL